MRKLPALLILLALAAGLSACGPTTVSSDQVEEQIVKLLKDAEGNAPNSASCPGELEGEKGATMTCTAKSGGEEFDVKVTVTSVEGDVVNFDIEPVD